MVPTYPDPLNLHQGVDLYVLERAFLSTHPNTEELFAKVKQSLDSKTKYA